VQETLGVGVPVETVRVLCEAVGTLAEAQAQGELAALQNGPRLEANGGARPGGWRSMGSRCHSIMAGMR